MRKDKEQELKDIMRFLETFQPPPTTSTKERQRFLSQAARHYRQGNHLYCRHASGHDQRVLLSRNKQQKFLKELHCQGHSCPSSNHAALYGMGVPH